MLLVSHPVAAGPADAGVPTVAAVPCILNESGITDVAGVPGK